MSTEFAINGRFLTQAVSGVQRYAHGIVGEIDEQLTDKKQAAASIIAPRNAASENFTRLNLRSGGAFSGHLWEQLTLPKLWPGRLLNLCNTAPAMKADQVVCIHDANVFESPESYDPKFRALYKTMQPLIARRSARIVSVSSFSAKSIARHLGLKPSDVEVLPNGHEHALSWRPERAKVATFVAQAVQGRPFVLAIGSRARHKNLKLLAQIAPELAQRGTDIVIAGGKSGVFTPDMLVGAANLHLIDVATDDDLAYLMDRALCLAFPSWTEGFGLPIVEAMARGCPVISSDRASMPEVCGSAACLVPPDDPALWLRGIDMLVESPSMRSDLAAAGREQVRRFSWKASAEGYLALMERPASRLPRPTRNSGPIPRVAVAIATLGRPSIVEATVRYLLEAQTLKPEIVIISCVKESDVGSSASLAGVRVVVAPPGLPAQRNAALALVSTDIDVLAFFDDDFVAESGWLMAAATAFRDEKDVVSFTGHVIVDDVKGPGLSFGEALDIIQTSPVPSDVTWIEPFSPYGCNMAFRMSAVGSLRFDERLVLYGWLEDRDFGASVAKGGGRLIKSPQARGVHMGSKGGRVSGHRFGYSQIINPVYMLSKGTMTPAQVAGQLFRNVSSNVKGAVSPERFIDRRGRLRGNIQGVLDILRGRVEPERAATLGRPKE